MSHTLLIVGSLGIDTIYTPAGSASHQLGGSATFAALAARHWTAPLILSAIGGDFPNDLMSILEREKLETKHLTVDPHAKSFRWAGRYDEGLGTRETVGVELGVMGTHTLHSPDMPKIKWVMMGNYNPLKQIELLTKLPAGCFISCDTIHGWIHHQHEDVLNLFRACTLISIDRDELLEAMKVGDEAVAVKKLLAMGPKWAIIKYGAQGSRLYASDGRSSAMGVYKTHTKDTTGAGDTYLGTIMAHLASVGRADFDTILHGMRLGAAAASITVEAFGIDSLVKATRPEIEKRAQQVKELTGAAV